jgi:hypothetical protein
MGSKIIQRLELALRVKKPTTGEVLEQVSTRGVLRGPVDWVFPAWMLYVEYATQRIVETFQLSEGERSQLLDFRDTLKRLLLEAQRQAKAKLASIYKVVAEGTYKMGDNKLYAPDGTWMYAEVFTPRILIRGVSASARFPDLLKLPRERLELLQLGWRASDEGSNKGRPVMGTTQPWQVFAWATVRYGEIYIRIASVNLTREGVSVTVHLKANSWRQKWSKAEAVDLVISHLRSGERAPLLTMWLGDGKARWRRIGREVAISTKEPQRLGRTLGEYEAIVAKGREAFVRLMEAAGTYGALLELLKAHKWIYVKKAVAKKRSIDLLKEAYGGNTATAPEGEEFRIGDVIIMNVPMRLELVNGNGGSLVAQYFTRDLEKALAIAGRLESAGLRPNVVRSNSKYMVYIGTADLAKLAERNETLRKAVAKYLAEKAKNGTPRQRELAEKILKRRPIFSPSFSEKNSSIAGPGFEPGTSGL